MITFLLLILIIMVGLSGLVLIDEAVFKYGVLHPLLGFVLTLIVGFGAVVLILKLPTKRKVRR